MPRRAVLGAVLVVLAVGSTVQSCIAQDELARVTDCQTRQNEAFRVALVQRGDAQRQLTEAQLRLLGKTSLSGDRSPATLDAYIEALHRVERVRQANPLAEPRECR